MTALSGSHLDHRFAGLDLRDATVRSASFEGCTDWTEVRPLALRTLGLRATELEQLLGWEDG